MIDSFKAEVFMVNYSENGLQPVLTMGNKWKHAQFYIV